MNDGLTADEVQMVAEIKTQLPFIMKMPNPDKSRCLLSLAYEYLIMDMEEEAMKLLRQADPEYFKDQLSKDMKEIPNMDIIVMSISSKLIELGIIKVVAKQEE
jgi:hypothetical protein